MKITLVVLFFAGLTIYCKCAAVLSLPQSLIAHAASLQRTQTPKSLPADNGKAGEDPTAAEENEHENAYTDGGGVGVGGIHGGVDSTVSYKNFKNFWQKNFGLQKRERNAFEDDIAAVMEAAVASPQLQQQQQQPNAEIKRNKNALKVVSIPPHQQQHLQQYSQQQQQQPSRQQTLDNDKNTFLKTTPSATIITPLNHPHHYQLPPLHSTADATEYDANEWLDNASGTKRLDDLIVSPHSIDDIRNDDSTDDINFAKQQLRYDVAPPPSEEEEDADNGYTGSADALDDAWGRFLEPYNYWSIKCQGKNGNNCPPEYYSALIADRKNALAQHFSNMNPFRDSSNSELKTSANIPNNINNDDIVLLLTAEQKLIKFLSWALTELYAYTKIPNASESSADSYDPDMYLWKTYNLSGRLEPPLLVEEPHYIVVQKQPNPEEEYKRGGSRDPFIPPRGRKHNLPDLDLLLQRYETFVPNRGRRDKIKDIFKYDDLFYPNRGKRQMTLATSDIDHHDDDDTGAEADSTIHIKRHQQQYHQHPLAKGENVAASLVQQQLQQHPVPKILQQINNVLATMKRKLHQMKLRRVQQELQKNVATSFDEMMSNNQPTSRMSVAYQPPRQKKLHKRFKSMGNILQQERGNRLTKNNNNNNNDDDDFSSTHQWGKGYWTVYDNDRPTAASARSRTIATNRLHALRSMSPQQKHQQQQQQIFDTTAMPQTREQQASEYISPFRFYQDPRFMLQPQQQLQLSQPFDPLSWYKLQMLQHQYHLPILTMRHPRLTVQQHLQQQHVDDDDDQLATPQETQLPPLYAPSDSINTSVDSALPNDLQRPNDMDVD